MSRLTPTIAPRLPSAPVEYDQRFVDQSNNTLRLYFNQLDAQSGALIGSLGGQFINAPYAAVQRTTNQTFTANNPTLITFDKSDYLNGATNNTSDGIHVQQSGIYNYQYSVQFANTDSSIHTAWLWLRVNNVDVAGTGSKFNVISSHGGTDGYIIAAANFYVQLNASDYVELWGAADNTAVYCEAYAAQVSPFAMPSVPSVVATLSFVSSLAK